MKIINCANVYIQLRFLYRSHLQGWPQEPTMKGNTVAKRNEQRENNVQSTKQNS